MDHSVHIIDKVQDDDNHENTNLIKWSIFFWI